jgi:hypothetical protein
VFRAGKPFEVEPSNYNVIKSGSDEHCQLILLEMAAKGHCDVKEFGEFHNAFLEKFEGEIENSRKQLAEHEARVKGWKN